MVACKLDGRSNNFSVPVRSSNNFFVLITDDCARPPPSIRGQRCITVCLEQPIGGLVQFFPVAGDVCS
ncbi:unnamed protein product [Trifolium pratense]|uniref:Uncharacterized protein n=1 Tax=Trifolium pratense TaxID=57577 RepID=A0ACB0J165_TRIPR|nr:unnamed protein product [Trifolium pratense]